MLSALILAATIGTHSLEPTDDVWIYMHAVDQTTDPYLRVWGDGSSDVGDPEAGGTSFSLVRFDLSKLGEDMGDLKKATLVFMHEIDPGFTVDESKDAPLQARMVDPEFNEKNWSFSQLTSHMPGGGKKAIVGQAGGKPSVDGKPFKIEIALDLKNESFLKALTEKAIAFALTTRMAPESAEGPMYKVYSRSAEKELRPRLILEFED